MDSKNLPLIEYLMFFYLTREFKKKALIRPSNIPIRFNLKKKTIVLRSLLYDDDT